MLSELTIQNFALVARLELELGPGMSAITGETGAGKSILLGALGLTLGDRADLDVIRSGEERADVSATFSLDGQSEAAAWLHEHDFPEADGLCILRRVLSRDGRSRAYINGQSTTLNELRTLGEMLIDIHGQHEHQSLLKTATHQRLLDAFGALEAQSQAVAASAQRLRRLTQEITELRHHQDSAAAEVELLSFQVQEFDAAQLVDNDLPALELEHAQLSNADAARAALQTLVQLCSEADEGNIEHSLRRACALMDALPYATPTLTEAGSMLASALIQVEEAGQTLNKALDRIELNPERLTEVDERLGLLHRLARKHRVEPGDLYQHAQQLRDKLAAISGADGRLAALQAEHDKELRTYHSQAAALSKARATAGKRLSDAVNKRLAQLGMADSRFAVALNSEPEGAPVARGHDHVEFLVSTNAGQPAKPLIKIASGGELSRISLAIQVVTAQTSSIPTLVFDEVDVGIGGGTARIVGELLRELGQRGQVLCVTHQAQVAAQANQHLLVSKSSDGQSTSTRLTALDRQGRLSEISRMLSGDTQSRQALAHAKELLDYATGPAA
ncbi:MAG: DNA repair protein RecN [Pseudomonadales bacterium]|jgi:DNA repair protein RecN (Recombination protein N)|nr:DNA repair protein RecN [Pseudomonadales bacterium]